MGSELVSGMLATPDLSVGAGEIMLTQIKQQSSLGSLTLTVSAEWQGVFSAAVEFSGRAKQQALNAAVVVFIRNTNAAI